MFKKLKSLFAAKEVAPKISEKDQATARGEPYVRVLNVNIDKQNPGDGYFELEWNQLFIKELLSAGYQGQSEEEIIDQWFTALCRNIAAGSDDGDTFM
jgi:hypothetical protein